MTPHDVAQEIPKMNKLACGCIEFRTSKFKLHNYNGPACDSSSCTEWHEDVFALNGEVMSETDLKSLATLSENWFHMGIEEGIAHCYAYCLHHRGNYAEIARLEKRWRHFGGKFDFQKSRAINDLLEQNTYLPRDCDHPVFADDPAFKDDPSFRRKNK